jgi:hypothetical protein
MAKRKNQEGNLFCPGDIIRKKRTAGKELAACEILFILLYYSSRDFQS